MLTFLAPFLVGGLVAVGAPILVHLFRRNRVVPMRWGAMMFLEELVAERSREIKLHQWLLLLVRVLLLACIALAMMRPAFKFSGLGDRPGDVHTSAVILLDDSFSMNAGRARTAWHTARDWALRYVDSLRRGDDVTILFTSSAGQGSAPGALFDLERARLLIREARPRYEVNDLSRALTAALQHLETRHNPRRELVLITDGQAEGWHLENGACWSYLSGLVRESQNSPYLLLALVSTSRPDNLTLTRLTSSRGLVDPYTPIQFHVTVANEGKQYVDNAVVTFCVNGATKATRNVGLPLGGREILTFQHQFERPGSNYVSCRLRSASDELADDNEIIESVLVLDKLRVLLVDGAPDLAPLKNETGFLNLALSPQDPEDPGWKTLIDTTVIDTTDLRHADFSKYRVIILANVAAIPGSVIAELERFVIGGGGLMISLGDQVRAEEYNRTLYRKGAGLLPVALGQIEGALGVNDDPKVSPEKGGKGNEAVHLSSIRAGESVLDMFRPENGQDWSQARIRSYFTTQAAMGDTEKVQILATYSDGQAALIQKKLGEGKVTLFTTSVDMDWSDLPIHPLYVPLMQGLSLDLASAIIPPRNLKVGQLLAYLSSGDAATKPYMLYPPKGESVHLKPERQGEWTVFSYENTQDPGLYVLSPETGTPGASIFYGVTADRAESDMDRLEGKDLERLKRDVGFKVAYDWVEIAQHIGLGSGGYEISSWLIWMAIILCFVEIYLTRRWA